MNNSKEISDIQTAIRINEFKRMHAQNQIVEATKEKEEATLVLILLNSYVKVIEPYLKRLVSLSQVESYAAAIHKRSYGVTLSNQGEEFHIVIVPEVSQDRNSVSFILDTPKTTLATTDGPQKMRSGVVPEVLPKEEELMERLRSVFEEPSAEPVRIPGTMKGPQGKVEVDRKMLKGVPESVECHRNAEEAGKDVAVAHNEDSEIVKPEGASSRVAQHKEGEKVEPANEADTKTDDEEALNWELLPEDDEDPVPDFFKRNDDKKSSDEGRVNPLEEDLPDYIVK